MGVAVPERWSWWRAVGLALLIGVAYALGSEIAEAWFDADGANASFFPAAGVTMAAVVALDMRWWPSVMIGAGVAEVLVDLSHDLPFDVSTAYAGANLGQALVGGLVLGQWRRRMDLARVGHLAAFVLGGVLFAPMVGGALGASVHTWVADGDQWWRFAVEWWVGDGLGVLVVGGTILGLLASTARGAVPAGGLERAVVATVVVGTTFLAFRLDWFALVYLPFALLFVIAIRAGTRDVAVVGALVAFVAAEGTARGHQVWDTPALDDATGLLYLQLALAVLIASALAMAAALAEREASTAARSTAEAAQTDAVVGRQRAELLGRLAESLGRAGSPDDVATALRAERLGHIRLHLPGAGPSTPSTDGPAGFGSTGAFPDVADDLITASARRMAADALERVQLIEDERGARQRAEMLEHHAARLAAAASMSEVAHATADGLAGLGSRWSAVWRLDAGAGAMSMLAERGVTDVGADTYRSVSLDADLPLVEAARLGTVVSCSTRDELFERYPAVLATSGADTGVQSIAVVPLRAQNLHVIGALVVTSDEERWLTDTRRQLLVSLADQCGLALDRAQLQSHAEQAAADAELLARLSDALDRSTTAQERARHVVGELLAHGATAVVVELSIDDDHVVLASDGQIDGAAPEHVVALQARGRVLGRLSVTGVAELTGGRVLLSAIASRAAIAIDNALLYERERDVSHRLQLGLLDVSFPAVEGVRIDGAYRPGTATLDIGGDWHDAFVLPSGALALVVGDVVGHGLEAAIAMAQLRGAVRAFAAVSSPSELLDRLDAFVDSLPAADMTTLVYVELDPTTGRFRYACAGHPPPLIVSATGVSRLLWGARSTPLGSPFNSRRVESIDVLGEAERLVLYTDGLVERRGEALDVGFDRLLAATAHDVASVDFVDTLATTMLDGVLQRDDVCLLAATRMDGRSFARSLAPTSSGLGSLRRELRGWLGQWLSVEDAVHDVLLAVSEAVSNAVEHGARNDADRPIVVIASISVDEVQITVRDHGVWRDPVVSAERGRGLGIMRALMDEVVVERHDDGTVVRLARSVGD